MGEGGGGVCVCENIYSYWVTIIESLDTKTGPIHNKKRASASNESISAVTCYIDGKTYMSRMH